MQVLTIEEARRLKESIYDEYQDVANEAMVILDEGFEDSITIMALPSKYRIALRTSNIIERENREIEKISKRSFNIFPNTESIIRLIGAVLQDDHNDWSVSHRIFDMKEYYDKLSSIQSNLLKIKAA
ncbi:MAG: transposase [Eubacterium ventriosum]|uniref:transposase n=1 Tax=Eubacterium ventriosum TaxID=39496 RepID=UPI00300F3A82